MEASRARRLEPLLCLAFTLAASECVADSNRLLATGGVMQIEGAAGGGLTPWALIAGLGTDEQWGGSAFCTNVRPQKFELRTCGVAFGWHDRVEVSLARQRVEVSLARQRLDLDEIIPRQAIEQDVIGLKVKLAGDAVFDQDRWLPQVSAGVQIKKNRDFAFVPALLGARDDSDVDVYVAATKVWLAGPFSRTWLVDATLRATRANQLGILGFGGDRRDSRSVAAEFALASFLTDRLVAGVEYRQKPDNLSAFHENDWWDAFAAYFPNKHCSMTVAYADLGRIAMMAGQRGWYLSLQAGL